MKAQKFYGWQVVAALWVTTFINMGFTTIGAGVINALMAKDMNFDRSVLGLGFTVLLLATGFAAPGVAWGLNRVGARMTICFASIVVALGSLLLAHMVTQAWQFVLVFGVVVGLGCGLGGNLPAQACVSQWFEKKRGLAMSITLSATSAGGFLAAPLLGKIIAATGGNWRAGWDFVAAMAMSAWLVSLLFVKNRPADHAQLPDGQLPAASGAIADAETCGKSVPIYRSADNWLLRDAYKTQALWLITLAPICTVVAISVFIAHVVPHLLDLGHPVAAAGLSLGTIAVGGIVGKLSAGFLCDRFEPRYVWFVAIMLIAAGVFLSTAASSSTEIYMFAICLGIGYGASLVCWPALVANYFGAGSFAAIFGIQTTITLTAASLSPFIVGLAHKSQSSYIHSFMVIAAVSLGAGVLLLLAKPPRHRLVETQ